ncbi:MAG: DJ-1/PfpI family protein [Eubacteriales bacterium]|mgnify:CR=1 FL=1|nr:DJ-1/PfpI family protein [Eubacteriales bacterium]MDD4422967.1 DJ-1/PfpI family protein [Eubacteriales bacterium]HBR31651.1 DJ-1 family protein [Clostridiales bacterium]
MIIYLLLADGFEESEAIVPADLLMRAGADVKLVSISESLAVKGAHNITINANILIDEVSKDDMGCLILPGGSEGTRRLGESIKVKTLIEAAVSKGVYIGAICAAPSILGKMNLLDGRRAACYPSFQNELSHSIITGKKIEHDDIFITAEGMGVSFEFGYKLIELLYGSGMTEKVKNAVRAESKTE